MRSMIFAALAAFFASATAFQGCVLHEISEQNKAAIKVYCNGYDVKFQPRTMDRLTPTVTALRVVHDERNVCSLVK